MQQYYKTIQNSDYNNSDYVTKENMKKHNQNWP